MNISQQLAILQQGVSEIIPLHGLHEKLQESEERRRPLIIKLGADPSSPDLHLGHTVVLRKLKDFQNCGHQIIFIIGDFTGMIGDPSGQSKTRKSLSKEEVTENARTYQKQIGKILDPQRTQILYNSHWIAQMTFQEVIELSSKYTVARMLERDDFHKRYHAKQGIAISEFLYALIQGYDSVHLQADIELGGTDQKFNLLVGRDLQKEFRQAPQTCITMPILEGLDGKQKMSKSLKNTISLTDSPQEIFGKIMAIPDALIYKYFLLLTDTPLEQIQKKEHKCRDGATRRLHKVELAKEIITLYYNSSQAERAQADFERIFVHKRTPHEIPQFQPEAERIWFQRFHKTQEPFSPKSHTLISLLTKSGLSPSNSESRRLIRSGAVSIKSTRITDENYQCIPEEGTIIQVGKRRYIELTHKALKRLPIIDFLMAIPFPCAEGTHTLEKFKTFIRHGELSVNNHIITDPESLLSLEEEMSLRFLGEICTLSNGKLSLENCQAAPFPVFFFSGDRARMPVFLQNFLLDAGLVEPEPEALDVVKNGALSLDHVDNLLCHRTSYAALSPIRLDFDLRPLLKTNALIVQLGSGVYAQGRRVMLV